VMVFGVMVFGMMVFGVRRAVATDRGVRAVRFVMLVAVMLVAGMMAGVLGLGRRVRNGASGLRKNRGGKHPARDRFVRVVVLIVMIMRLGADLHMVMIVVVVIVMLVVPAGMVMPGRVVRVGVLVRMPGVSRGIVLVRRFALNELRGLGPIGSMLNDVALDALAAGTAAGVAMARTAAAGTVLALFFRLAMGALVGLDQRLTVGDRDLVIVRMNFAEGEEAVAVAAVFDEGCLQRRLYPRDLGEVDIAAQLLALGGLEIKLFDSIAADHNDPGLFRVGGVDQHFVGHF